MSRPRIDLTGSVNNRRQDARESALDEGAFFTCRNAGEAAFARPVHHDTRTHPAIAPRTALPPAFLQSCPGLRDRRGEDETTGGRETGLDRGRATRRQGGDHDPHFPATFILAHCNLPVRRARVMSQGSRLLSWSGTRTGAICRVLFPSIPERPETTKTTINMGIDSMTAVCRGFTAAE